MDKGSVHAVQGSAAQLPLNVFRQVARRHGRGNLDLQRRVGNQLEGAGLGREVTEVLDHRRNVREMQWSKVLDLCFFSRHFRNGANTAVVLSILVRSHHPPDPVERQADEAQVNQTSYPGAIGGTTFRAFLRIGGNLCFAVFAGH
ncbi:hypothetical protein D9M71_615010 [compost metagenome]